jgi:hypothetical protein
VQSHSVVTPLDCHFLRIVAQLRRVRACTHHWLRWWARSRQCRSITGNRAFSFGPPSSAIAFPLSYHGARKHEPYFTVPVPAIQNVVDHFSFAGSGCSRHDATMSRLTYSVNISNAPFFATFLPTLVPYSFFAPPLFASPVFLAFSSWRITLSEANRSSPVRWANAPAGICARVASKHTSSRKCASPHE